MAQTVIKEYERFKRKHPVEDLERRHMRTDREPGPPTRLAVGSAQDRQAGHSCKENQEVNLHLENHEASR